MLGNSYCGGFLPPSRISSSNHLFFHFHTNDRDTETGFQLEYNATSKNYIQSRFLVTFCQKLRKRILKSKFFLWLFSYQNHTFQNDFSSEWFQIKHSFLMFGNDSKGVFWILWKLVGQFVLKCCLIFIFWSSLSRNLNHSPNTKVLYFS